MSASGESAAWGKLPIGIVGAAVVLLGGAFDDMFGELSARMTSAVT